MQPLDRIGEGCSGSGQRHTTAQDRFLDHSEEQLVLAGEVPVERLQRDVAGAGELLDRHCCAALGDEPLGAEDDLACLLDRVLLRPAHGRRMFEDSRRPRHSLAPPRA